MSKKHTFKKTAALLLGLALTAGATGCNFFPTNNEKDLQQEVATVNITSKLAEDAKYKAVASQVDDLVGDAVIYKSDLVAYFLSTGYTYVENYGYSYEDTFNMLLDGLVSREIMLQYAIAHYLSKGGEYSYDKCKAAVSTAKNKRQEEVYLYKFFLSEEDEDRAEYSLKKSLNDALDSTEQSYIVASNEEHNHAEARTMPTNATTEKEDYYTTNYDVYTGRNAISETNEYEKLEGSTAVTRRKAYNAFLANLQSYNLIGEDEDTSKLYDLDYYYIELASSLSQALLNNYFEDLETEAIANLTDEYVQGKYETIYNQQQQKYENDAAAFGTAIDGLSDDSFVLYGKEGYGFVYNILIPFSTSQNIKYTEAKNRGLSQEDLYKYRKALLSEVEGEDLRSTWISDHDHADYSYWKDGKLYFFEDNFSENSKYEKLSQYAGDYPFNGIYENKDGVAYDNKEDVKSDSVDIEEFIEIFEDYIAKTSGCTVIGSENTAYDLGVGETYYNETEEDYDYNKFTYYTGKVNFTETPVNSYFFKADTQAYKALSAVNELMFAYSTDTGCLNTYMGYSVAPDTTNFVKEFEYAAQEVVKAGVGNYAVCATDYGWHIVYCSFVYGQDGDVYGGFKASEKETEGTFSYIFYESLKETAITNYTNEKQSTILNKYDVDGCVTRYQDAYQDLLDIQTQA